MLRHLKKLWLDTTTNPATGKYSQKRLMMWGAFNMAMFLCFVSVVELHFSGGFDMRLRVPETELIIVLFSVALGASAATIAGHYFNRKTADNNGQPLRPAFEDDTDPATQHHNKKNYDA